MLIFSRPLSSARLAEGTALGVRCDDGEVICAHNYASYVGRRVSRRARDLRCTCCTVRNTTDFAARALSSVDARPSKPLAPAAIHYFVPPPAV